MNNVEDVSYPRYAFLDHLAWVGDIFYYRGFRLIEEHCAEAKAEYERLMAFPDHQQVVSHEKEKGWRQAIDEGRLSIDELRQELYIHYGILPCMYNRPYSVYHAINSHHLTREETKAQEDRILLVDKRIDEILHAEQYAGLYYAFDWGGLHLVARPTGVTEELCYQFVSAHKGKNGKNWEKRFRLSRYLAHAEAYILERAEVVTHLHARSNGKETVVAEKADFDLGRDFFRYREETLRTIGRSWGKGQ